jgi:hypothetical protein
MASQWPIFSRRVSLAVLFIVQGKETMKSVALPLIALIAFAGYTLSVMLEAEQSLIAGKSCSHLETL